MLDCLNNIVSLSRSECECFNLPDETYQPTSGIYLDELAGGGLLKMLFCSEQCGTDFYTKSMQLIEQATQCFEADFKSLISSRFRPNPELFNMKMIGGKHNHNVTALNKNLAVVKLCARGQKSTSLVIENIGLSPFVNSNKQRVELCKNIKIYDENGCKVEIPAIEIKTDKRKIVWANFTQPIELPLTGNCTNCYYITYQNCGNNPLRTTDWCGCGSKRPAWLQTIGIDTFTTDTLDEMTTCSGACNAKGQNVTYGIHLSVSLKCNQDDMLCCLFEENEGIQNSASKAIAYKAIELIINDLISKNSLNYTTIAARKNWLGNISSVRNSYHQILKGEDRQGGILNLIDTQNEVLSGCLCPKKGLFSRRRF